MKRSRRGFVIVTGEGGVPVGVIADSDLIKHVVVCDKRASQVKISDIMSRRLIVVSPDDDILVATRKMKRNNIHRLPVIQGKRVVGVISMTDIARTSPEMYDLLEYRLKMKEEPPTIREEFTAGICDRCLNYYPRLKKVNDEWLCEGCREVEV
jgi:predicted transcriptional regulator